jgi:predicted nuclease of predicted toxin-antitoxin system
VKLLLDEQLPRRLAHRLVPLHDALTVQDMDWHGKKNGELLKLLIEHEFEAFVTADKKMRYEQNWRNYTIAVIFLDVPNLKYDTVKQLVPQVLALLTQPGLAGGVHVVP